MQIDDLISEIERLFPGARVRSWEPRYRDILGEAEGPGLQSAWDATIRGWKKSTFPKPADVLVNIAVRASKPKEPTEQDREVWAVEVMRSPAGQEAIEKGYARELWIWAKRYPNSRPGQITINECAAATKRFHDKLVQLRTEGSPSGMKVAQAMLAFEANLKKTYYVPQLEAAE